MDKEYIGWKQFGYAVERMVNEYKLKQYDCDYVYGIPRGGLPFAVMLSRMLHLPIVMDLSEYDTKHLVLLTDDIADSGDTLDLHKKYFPNRIIFTMHYHKQSKVMPDFWVYEKTDKWIVYPWEID